MMKKQIYSYEIMPSIGMLTSCVPMDTNSQWSGNVAMKTDYQWNVSFSENCQCYGGGSTVYCQHNSMTNDMKRMIWRCDNEIY